MQSRDIASTVYRLTVFCVSGLLVLVAANSVRAQVSGHAFAAPLAAPYSAMPTPVTEVFRPTGVSSQIMLDSSRTAPLLDFQNRQSDKELLLLQPPATGTETYPQIILGAQFRASGVFGKTNTENRFPYLGRFPTDFSGNTVTDARLVQANQALIARVNSWAQGYVETLFSDVFSFNAPKQGSFQIRQAFVLFGNASSSPWYVFLGKKNVTFGDFETLSPFTQAVPWHYFAPLAEGVGGGYSRGGFDLSVMALNGSRGIRVADSDERGHLNNFAVNARQTIPLMINGEISFGAGYLYGTIYDGLTAEHTDPTIIGPRNGVWDANARMRLGNWHLRAELVQTENAWPVTGREVTAYAVETALDLPTSRSPMRLSASWSEGIQGAAGTEFEFNRQLVIGWQIRPTPGLMCSLEYVRSSGFAPLINITTASDRDAVQHSMVLGVTLVL